MMFLSDEFFQYFFIFTTILLLTPILSAVCPDMYYLAMNSLLNFVSAIGKDTIESEYQCRYAFIVLPGDIDRSFHMNNAKYLRHLNFSRKYLWRKLGLWQRVQDLGCTMVMSSQSIRYRRELRLFDRYDIVSRIVCYVDSENSFYVESRFVKNNFVHAIHWVKYMAIHPKEKKKSSDPALKPSQLLKDCNVSGIEKLATVPPDIEAWVLANALSSKRLRLNA